jgi:alpha-L-rhamnosidase
MYEMFGDTKIIHQHWSRLTRFMEHLESVAPSGIRGVGAYGDWLLLDAPQQSALHGTAYYFYSAKLMQTLAEATQKFEDAKKYQALAEKIKRAFIEKFVTPEGLIADNGKSSQTFNALALGWDLIPKENRLSVGRALEKQIQSRGNHLATGFIGTPVVLFALDSVGRSELANNLVLGETFPSWLYQVKLGATSMWERWDGWTPEKGFQDAGMNSFNHYWLGCVEEWMVTGLVGIDTDGPGWKKIVVRPRITDKLNRASATYQSIRGKIAAGWQRNLDQSITLTVSIPANTTARIELPGKTETIGSGDYVFVIK